MKTLMIAIALLASSGVARAGNADVYTLLMFQGDNVTGIEYKLTQAKCNAALKVAAKVSKALKSPAEFVCQSNADEDAG